MSHINCIYITSIPVFHGIQGKFYVVDRYKYHTRFPIEWALNHTIFRTGRRKEFIEGSGPKDCDNCREYGTIRGVFVGYCGTCLDHYKNSKEWRGNPMGGWDINDLDISSIHQMYPYMIGVNKSEIGDDDYDDNLRQEEEQE